MQPAFASNIDRPEPLIREARTALAAGDGSAFIPALRQAIENWPDNPRLPELLATILEAEDQLVAASAALLDAARRVQLSSNQLRRAYALARRENSDALMRRACELSLDQHPSEAWALEAMLRLVDRSGDAQAMLDLTESFSTEQRRHPVAAFHRFRALTQVGSAELSGARDEALAAFATSDRPHLWTGRLLRLVHDGPGAEAAFARAFASDPEDITAATELMALAIGRGTVGQHAAALLRAAPPAGSELERELAAVKHFFATLGGSLELAAAGVEPFASLSSPDAAIEWLCTHVEADRSEPRHGIMMVGGSLAAGGAERILATLFSAFRERRGAESVRLCLFDLEDGKPSSFYLPLTGVAADDVLLAIAPSVSHPQIAWLPRGMARRTQAIYDHLVAHRPAVVHATLDLANVCAAYAALLAGVPRIVMHVHNMRPTELTHFEEFHPNFDRCYRALLARPEVSLIGVAEPSVADYLDWSQAGPGARTHVVHNGFDFTPFESEAAQREAAALRESLRLSPNDRLIGTAIRFTELKRPLWWVEMAAELATDYPDLQFVMFGDGELRAETEALIAAKGLSGRIHLPGRVSNLHELLGALDIFVLSSRTEGLPNVLIEAQAAGVAVVTFDVGGARDTFDDEKTGLLVREQSAAALAAAVRTILVPERLAAMKSNARAFVRERFAVSPMIEKVLRILDGEPESAASQSPDELAIKTWFGRLRGLVRRPANTTLSS